MTRKTWSNFPHWWLKKIHTPVPLDAGGLTIAVAEALLSDEAVLQLILNAEGMRWSGLVLWTRVLLKEGVRQRRFSCQAIHGVKGQDTLKEVHSWEGKRRCGSKAKIICVRPPNIFTRLQHHFICHRSEELWFSISFFLPSSTSIICSLHTLKSLTFLFSPSLSPHHSPWGSTSGRSSEKGFFTFHSWLTYEGIT